MVQMKPIDLKKVAKRFTEKYYPQWLSRVDRIWDMFEKIDIESFVSESSNSQSQLGNAFGIAGEVEPKFQECMSGIAIFAFTYQGVKDKNIVSEDEIRKRVTIVPGGFNMPAGLQGKLENVLSEMLPLVGNSIEGQAENQANDLPSSVGASEYRVWYNDSEPSGLPIDIFTKEKIVTQKREKYNLFIVREGALTQIFINGDSATSKPSKFGYRILALALKHRGNCGTAWNIAKHIYDIEEAEKFKDLREVVKVAKEQLKLNMALDKFKTDPDSIENYSNRVRRLIAPLNQKFLEKLNTKLKANEMDEFEINPSFTYCLIEIN